MKKWLKFNTKRRDDRFAPEVVELTARQVHELRQADLRFMVTCSEGLVYFEVGDDELQAHYVLLDPSSQSGRRERDYVLGDEYALRFIYNKQTVGVGA